MEENQNKLHRLLAEGRLYKIPKGQIVQSSDDRFRPLINLVKKGFVKRYEISDDGNISVQSIYGPGSIFPLSLIYEYIFQRKVYDSPEVMYYEAMTDTEIISSDMSRICEAIKNDNLLFKDLFLESGLRLHLNLSNLENHSLKNSFRRTAHIIAFYAREYGEPNASGTKIKVNLTHQDIADILNLTRETVSLNVHMLQKKGLIKTGRAAILVPDIKKLELSIQSKEEIATGRYQDTQSIRRLQKL
ncbi:MAG TPA: Crp/Fnr family transcriptional regulator [Chitinophagaceae bacterium]|nr:Crp/Fnr family transcriptional regulator [Chitinophagaceae bacterium]